MAEEGAVCLKRVREQRPVETGERDFLSLC